MRSFCVLLQLQLEPASFCINLELNKVLVRKKKKTIKRLPIGRWTGILQVSTVIVCFSFLQEDDEQTLECGDADAANAQNTCTQIIRVMVPSVKGS